MPSYFSDVSNNNILSPPPPFLFLIATQALKKNRVVHTINLEKNVIGDVGAAALAKALLVNDVVVELELKWYVMMVCG